MIVDSSVSGFTIHNYLRKIRLHEMWNDIWTLIDTKLSQDTSLQPICLPGFYPLWVFFAAATLLLYIPCQS